MHSLSIANSTSTGYLKIPRIEKYRQIVDKMLNTDQGSTIAVFGPKRSGKRSFLQSVLEKNSIDGFTVDASEISTDGKLNLEKLVKAVRSTVCVEIKEHLKIIEGEVTLITHDRLQLKTRDMESVFDIGIRMRRELERERVCVGDIVKIYKESCFVTRVGKSVDRPVSDLLPRIPLPEGECIKVENTVSILTLDELDSINSNENVFENCNTSKYIRDDVDRKVQIMLKENKAVLKRRVLIVYGCECFDVDSLDQLLFSTIFKPNIFLIFNLPTDEEKIRLINNKIISLKFDEYNKNEIEEIVNYFCSEFQFKLEKTTLDAILTKIQKRGIGYFIDIINASRKDKNIMENHLKELVSIFD